MDYSEELCTTRAHCPDTPLDFAQQPAKKNLPKAKSCKQKFEELKKQVRLDPSVEQSRKARAQELQEQYFKCVASRTPILISGYGRYPRLMIKAEN
jgi:hypothetical protein